MKNFESYCIPESNWKAVILPARRYWLVCVACLAAVVLVSEFMLSPIAIFGRSKGARHRLPTSLAHDQYRFPTPLSPIIVQPSGPVHLFTVPTLLTHYEEVLPNNHRKLYLVTSGIMMEVSKRNLNAVACQVGDDIYPSSFFISEVLLCEIPRPLRRGERLAAVLAWDEQLKRAARGPVKLNTTGIIAELHPGDIEKLPETSVLREELASANRDDFRVARSDVHVGPSDNFAAKDAKLLPRYRLCLMTMVAPNSHMLKDWADYHRRIGVDQVYIFDNGAELDLKKVFENRSDVEIVSWPYHKSQRQAVSSFVFAARSRCERTLLEDSDEYPMFGLGEDTSWRNRDPPLIHHAKKVEKKGFLNYKLLHLVMINSGFLHRPKGRVPMNFIHRRKRQNFVNGKSVCYMDLEWQAGAIHFCGFINGKKPEIYAEKITTWGEKKMTPEDPEDPPYLIHFRDRSWEEYVAKWKAGRVSGRLVADERARSMSMDDPEENYMAVYPGLEYTHFRDKIYQRVLKDGTLREQTIVQMREGRRCELQYRIGKNKIELVHENCV